jgi:hypothetical protein
MSVRAIVCVCLHILTILTDGIKLVGQVEFESHSRTLNPKPQPFGLAVQNSKWLGSLRRLGV